MFFVDEPYISDFLKITLRDNAIPVVNNTSAKKFNLLPGTQLMSEEQAINNVAENGGYTIYSTSENAISWVVKNLAFSDLPAKIEQFKNKALFRENTRTLYPEFFFKEIALQDLDALSIEGFPLPFIIKPSIGFFSMGVHKVTSSSEWQGVVAAIHAELKSIQELYPEEVLDTRTFIIEQCIDGDEFAVDAYFNATGEPVILNILHHTFSSDSDVSDRVYTTSKDIIENNLAEFGDFVRKIGVATQTKNFPVHIELRRTKDGELLPIEVNPMRFGGWCSTPDLAFLAYGINPYLCYFHQQAPNWTEILKGKDGKLFSVVVLDNSTGKNADEIAAFDFDKLLTHFEKPLELREIDYHQYPVFAFLFVETSADNFKELEFILNSDLTEFILTHE